MSHIHSFYCKVELGEEISSQWGSALFTADSDDDGYTVVLVAAESLQLTWIFTQKQGRLDDWEIEP